MFHGQLSQPKKRKEEEISQVESCKLLKEQDDLVVSVFQGLPLLGKQSNTTDGEGQSKRDPTSRTRALGPT